MADRTRTWRPASAVDGSASPSVMAIQGHPLHPMLVPMPIGALVFLLGTDVAFLSSGDPFWARASVWLLAIGVITAVIAGLVGAGDFMSIRRARQGHAGWIHAIGNGVVLVLAIVNWSLRTDDPTLGVQPWGIAISGVTVALLGLTGWMGGELAYRYRIGVLPNEHATGSPELDARRVRDQAISSGPGDASPASPGPRG